MTIICPRCGTENADGSQFCIQCGRPLHESTPPSLPRRTVGATTLQLLLALLGLWFLRLVLEALAFVRELEFVTIGYRITAVQIVAAALTLLMVVLLLRYVQILGREWPRSFPRYRALLPALTAILWLFVLNLLYRLAPLFVPLFPDYPSEFMLGVRVVFFLAAVLIAARAAVLVYAALPALIRTVWVDMRTYVLAIESGEEPEDAA